MFWLCYKMVKNLNKTAKNIVFLTHRLDLNWGFLFKIYLDTSKPFISIIILSTGDMGRFKEHTMCNLEYLLATAHCNTIHSLIHRLQLTVTQVMDIELSLILRCVTLGETILHYDPLQLASEIIGRLRQLKGTVFQLTLYIRCA